MWLVAGLFDFVNFSVNYLNDKISEILSDMNQLIWFYWLIRSVTYWLLPGSAQNTLLWLMVVWISFIKITLLIWSIENKSKMLSQMNKLMWFHWAITSVNYCWGEQPALPGKGPTLAVGGYNPQAALDIVNKWYKKLLSSAVAFVNREEIRNLIRNELVDFLQLGDWFCKLLDHSCNRTKYVQCHY